MRALTQRPSRRRSIGDGGAREAPVAAHFDDVRGAVGAVGSDGSRREGWRRNGGAVGLASEGGAEIAERPEGLAEFGSGFVYGQAVAEVSAGRFVLAMVRAGGRRKCRAREFISICRMPDITRMSSRGKRMSYASGKSQYFGPSSRIRRGTLSFR